MDFYAVLDQVITLLQQRGRVTYRALQRQFALDDAALADLKDELLFSSPQITEEDGRGLVWTGAPSVSTQVSALSSSPPPAAQTPNAELQTADSLHAQSPAERRQLTVMFCDLVGSTALSAQLDPEELREVIGAYQTTCAEIIARFDGTIAQYLGDGVLVYFGYPTAHEDDAQRAVRAGLDIVATMREQGTENGGQNDTQEGREQLAAPLQVRIGIHTGPVVVGEIGTGTRREQLALGETPNIAARIQGLAEPNTVAVSAATYRLVSSFFDCQTLGAQSVKGIGTPIDVHRVLAASLTQHRLDAVPVTGLTPLVGREEELALLQRRWEQTKDHEGQVVLLSGEPGIGKSRLVRELRTWVEHDQAIRIEFRCSPYYQNSAFYPIIDHLQHLLQWHKDDTPQNKLNKLQVTLAGYRFLQAETLPLLAALLSLPHPAHAPPLHLSPQRQKQKTEEALIAWLLEEADRAPLYCAWEDLHWADPSTLELLGQLINQTTTARLFLLLTSRPEFSPPWGQHGHFSQLTLSRLGRRQAPQMIAQVVGGKTLPAEVVQQIVAKTDGVPLFVEELTKMVLESGLLTETDDHYELRDPLPSLAIPSTLQDSLMARLDRLATIKEIAQLGATIGREFSYELLHAVSPLDEQTLQHGLQQLVATELVYQRGMPPHVSYVFKHALIQDTAYQSLLKSRRQQLHQQIAEVIETQFSDTKATHPELLAHHYTEGGLPQPAIAYWQRAGTLALNRFALNEAIAYLNQGMVLLSMLPPSAARNGTELELRTRLGTAWIALKGGSASEVWTSLYSALELAKSLRRHDTLLPIYNGLAMHLLTQGRLTESRAWVEDMLATAAANDDPDLVLVAHRTACLISFWQGDITQSRAHGDQVFTLYDVGKHRYIADLINLDPKTTAGVFVAFGTWLLGYPDQAVQLLQATDHHARQCGHVFDLGWVLALGSYVWALRRDPESLLERVEEAERLGHSHGLPFIADVLAQLWKGVAWLQAGRFAEGIPHLGRAMVLSSARGSELVMPYYRAVLAEGVALSGDVAEGLRLLEESLAQVVQPGREERCHLAELLRLKGWMLTLQNDLVGAEHNYLAARDWARTQQAKSWELRVSTSLARLWQQQGKSTKAHKLLSEIYNWFTEGFDTKDLQDAKALLDVLAGVR